MDQRHSEYVEYYRARLKKYEGNPMYPHSEAAERGGYAADVVPMIHGYLPYANLHDELVAELLKLDVAIGPISPIGPIIGPI